jgi:DNA-binding MarR family transcriptional regulator
MRQTAKLSAGDAAVPERQGRARPRLELDAHLSFLIVALANKISSCASFTYMRHFGVGVMEWRVLAMVAAHPGVTAKGISEVSGIEKSSISRAIHMLIKRGYLEATNDLSDSRRALCVLTAAGYALHDRIYAASMARRRLLLTGFSDAEHRQIIEYCRRLMTNMSLVNEYRPSDAPALGASKGRRERTRKHTP